MDVFKLYAYRRLQGFFNLAFFLGGGMFFFNFRDGEAVGFNSGGVRAFGVLFGAFDVFAGHGTIFFHDQFRFFDGILMGAQGGFVQSFPGLADDYSATCFAQSMMLEDGVGTSTLGDFNTALTVLLLTQLSPEPVYYGDLQHIDKNTNEIKIIGDGACPPSLAGKLGPARPRRRRDLPRPVDAGAGGRLRGGAQSRAADRWQRPVLRRAHRRAVPRTAVAPDRSTFPCDRS